MDHLRDNDDPWQVWQKLCVFFLQNSCLFACPFDCFQNNVFVPTHPDPMYSVCMPWTSYPYGVPANLSRGHLYCAAALEDRPFSGLVTYTRMHTAPPITATHSFESEHDEGEPSPVESPPTAGTAPPQAPPFAHESGRPEQGGPPAAPQDQPGGQESQTRSRQSAVPPLSLPRKSRN
eukprot:GHVU01013186.1.p2 GENE.GHVU01013186.1~~GHVU01013186.1.p2  ORF type:complete len:177 (-),score=5.66 GHVU01013186.1:841-1371(-)